MERLDRSVLSDPSFLIPPVAGGESGLPWLRQHVARFCDGDAHARRRGLVEAVIQELEAARFVSSPTASLLRAMGLPAALAEDVALVAGSYQPHSGQSTEADAAADRLVQACGGRDEQSAARVCVLVQAHAATDALIRTRREGSSDAPVATTRRARPDGTVVEVDLRDAHYGEGPHRCPGRDLAERFAAEALQ